LERVKILRVFDFVGVVEAVNEVRDELQGRLKEDKLQIENQLEEPRRREIADSSSTTFHK